MVLNLRTKGDLIQDALSKMKISGITAPPDAEDTQLMVQKLEGMLYEFQARGLDLKFNFTMDPDPADFHGMEFYAFQPISSILALRAVHDFGLEAPQTLILQARAGDDVISAISGRNKLRQVQYPSRQPRGSGNSQRYIRWRTFYPEPFHAPLQPPAIRLRVGEINDYTFDMSDDLRAGETITNVAVEASDGVTYTQRSLTATAIHYRIEALTGSNNRIETVQFTVTTSTGRVIINVQTVELTEDPYLQNSSQY